MVLVENGSIEAEDTVSYPTALTIIGTDMEGLKRFWLKMVPLGQRTL
jgi:hypothetical protein